MYIHNLSVVSSPDPPIPQRWMYYITNMWKEGLENIARFSCATGMQSNAKSHDTRPHGILISDELTCETAGFSQNEGLQNLFSVRLSSDWNASKRSKDGGMVRPLLILTAKCCRPLSLKIRKPTS